MLSQLGRHGGFDLTVRTRGDLEVDAHHTVEDTSIALGQALREALGDKAGHPPVRRRPGAAGRDARAGRGGPVRPALPRARRARGRRAHRQLRHHPDPAHLGVDDRERLDLPARPGAVRAQRAPRRRGAVQGGGARAADRGVPRPARRGRPVHQGHPCDDAASQRRRPRLRLRQPALGGTRPGAGRRRRRRDQRRGRARWRPTGWSCRASVRSPRAWRACGRSPGRG